MDRTIVCWKCGVSLADMPLPFARLAECRKCRARLHVCRMCEFYDPHRANQCREPIAEFVQDKERANFCGYFKPGTGTYAAGDKSRTQAARGNLNALFGLAAEPEDGTEALSASAQARKKLDDLFRK
ncbi:MAG: hypothetical protein ACRESK_03035 [Gammaproteobacteria bacterium]